MHVWLTYPHLVQRNSNVIIHCLCNGQRYMYHHMPWKILLIWYVFLLVNQYSTMIFHYHVEVEKYDLVFQIVLKNLMIGVFLQMDWHSQYQYLINQWIHHLPPHVSLVLVVKLIALHHGLWLILFHLYHMTCLSFIRTVVLRIVI